MVFNLCTVVTAPRLVVFVTLPNILGVVLELHIFQEASFLLQQEVVGLVIQGQLYSHLTNEPEDEEVIEVNNKWETWEKSIGKKIVI